MKEKILHCTDKSKLNQELIDAGFYHEDESGKYAYIPVDSVGVEVKKGNESLICSLIVEDDENLLSAITSINVLGTYEEIFSDESKIAVYSSIYDTSEKIFIDEETGAEIKYTPPKKFAVFAL
ncbi:hypothetical protein AB832_07330 [Flavobacteriaceae bacterium (ex Bugula neritina AB1)]|nr:hypothetical protein AB832_07330 [Flavobacteriaceae bacterium (ex Bugula neritina AB1)]